MVGSGGLCWRGKKETRLKKSGNSVKEVLETETQHSNALDSEIPLPNKEMS